MKLQWVENHVKFIFFSKYSFFLVWYQQIFKGNIDDGFCLGLGLHNGQLEIMTKYFESDILIATPLGIQKENANERM